MMLTPIRCFILLALLCFICPVAALAADQELFTPEQLQWMSEHPEIKVIYNSGPPPLSNIQGIDPPAPNEGDAPPPPHGPPPLPHGTASPPPHGTHGPPPPPPEHPGSHIPLLKLGPDDQDRVSGVTKDYLAEISHLTGLSFPATLASANNFKALHEAIINGEADLTPSLMAARDSFERFLVTDTYINIPVVVVMRQDMPHLADFSTLSSMDVAGVFSIPPKLANLGIDLRLHQTSPRQGLMGVATGKFDAFIAELSAVSHVLGAHPISNIKIVGELPAPSPFCMGVSPQMEPLIPIINTAIAAIPTERKQAIWQKWFPIYYEKSIVSSGWLLTIGAASALALGLGGFGFLYYRRRNQRLRSGLAALDPHLLCVHTDDSITITSVTKALCMLTGYSLQDLVGKPFTVLGELPESELHSLESLFDSLQSTGTWKGEAKLLKKDGSSLWTDVIITTGKRQHDDQGFTIIYQDATERKKFEDLAVRDELTGLFNKRYFGNTVPAQLDAARSSGASYALLLMDVDYFKKYNDNYGHPAGDKVLAAIGKTLRSTLKRDHDLSFRLGGEEFGSVLSLKDPVEAQRMAETILTAIRGLGIEHEHNPPGLVTISMGVCVSSPDDARSLDELYEAADKALYAAKEGGRDRFIIHGS